MRKHNTGCIKMIGAVSICHYGYQNARKSKFPPHGTKQQVFKFCAHAQSHSPLLSHGLWRNKTIMATPEQKAFCVLQIVKHESVVSVQRPFRRQFNSDPHLPIALDAGISSFRQRGAFVKEKVQDGRVCQKKCSNEWDSLFFAVRRKENF